MRRFHPVLLGLLSLAPVLSCGDDTNTVIVELTLQGSDALTGVVRIRLTASGPSPMKPVSTEAAYHKGGQVFLPPIPFGNSRVLTIEGLDSSGLSVSAGQSKPFDLTPDAPKRIAVSLSRCAVTVFRDADGDGYGDPATKVTGCASAGAGHVTDGSDCNDKNRDVHPGQKSYFTLPVAGGSGFDYDCSGTDDPSDAQAVDCASSTACKDLQGWKGAAPACGAEGTHVVCAKVTGKCGETGATQKTQGCR